MAGPWGGLLYQNELADEAGSYRAPEEGRGENRRLIQGVFICPRVKEIKFPFSQSVCTESKSIFEDISKTTGAVVGSQLLGEVLCNILFGYRVKLSK